MITADYIVVGAGSAGAAVAARLSEDESCNVLLLEAGGPDSNPDIHIPARFSELFHTEDDWDYQTIPQPGLNNRREYVPRGKVFGGTSSMNAMVYQRGHPSDYDGWAARGNEGWAYEDLLPFFRKMQHQERGESAHHGVDGPINVADPQDPNPLSIAFVDAALELGYAHNADFNDGEQEGFGVYQVTQKRGQRHSTAVGYLQPALRRPNFNAIPFAQVTKLIVEDTRCLGVEYRHDGELKTARAKREVVLCGGAINSPQLLPALRALDPPIISPNLTFRWCTTCQAWDRNLMDHIQVPLAYHCKAPLSLVDKDAPEQIKRYREQKMGMLTSNLGESGGFVRQDPGSPAPELQYHFGPDWFVRHGFETPAGHGFTILVGLVGTMSRRRAQAAFRRIPSRRRPLTSPVSWKTAMFKCCWMGSSLGERSQLPRRSSLIVALSFSLASKSQRMTSSSTSSASSRQRSIIRPAAAEWVVTRLRWLTNGCVHTGSPACASLMPRSCRASSMPIPMRPAS